MSDSEARFEYAAGELVQPRQEHLTFSVPKFRCPRHGVHEHVIKSTIKNFEGHWCILCAIENLERLRISKVEKVE